MGPYNGKPLSPKVFVLFCFVLFLFLFVCFYYSRDLHYVPTIREQYKEQNVMAKQGGTGQRAENGKGKNKNKKKKKKKPNKTNGSNFFFQFFIFNLFIST